MDFNEGFNREELIIFQDTLQGDDRDFCAHFAQAQEENWPELSLQSSEVVGQDYDNLPDLNPVTSSIGDVRRFIMKGGIPGLLAYNGVKATIAATGAYMICPGDTETKTAAASLAGVGMLSGSPTLWTAGALIGAKIGKRALRSIASPKL